MSLREQITITKASSYSKSSSGQITEAGTTTIGTYFANVTQLTTTDETTGLQYVHENKFMFTVRVDPDNTFNKEMRIAWRSDTYQIEEIKDQQLYNNFVKLIATNIA